VIPRVYHFIFGLKPQTEAFHLLYYLCLTSCLEVNRPDALVFHYHHEPFGPWWERIRPRLQLRRVAPNAFVEGFAYADPTVARYRYAHAADFLRLQILLEEGGIYADIDSLFLRPLPARLHAQACVLGEERSPQPGARSLCNAWIGAAPGSAFIRHWLDAMEAAFDGSWSAHSTLLPARLAAAHPDLLQIEPESAFYAFDWSPRGINDLFVRKRPLPAQAYSLHLWNHLWWERRRRDFSRFHAGRLTPGYVAHARSSYAELARPFLPPELAGSRLAYWGDCLRAGLQEGVDGLLGPLARWQGSRS